ncbi:MAG: alanine--tRNA ligase-related protein [Mollicutes bacterium]|nr:MAG: alanine--tRNA ligase-related protein [Mollicutes bacterium]
MAGIKDYFLGRKIPPAPRLFNIQKAVRTNDLNNIGHTNRHLSFFEMMGNFALNDYQKSEAIQ